MLGASPGRAAPPILTFPASNAPDLASSGSPPHLVLDVELIDADERRTAREASGNQVPGKAVMAVTHGSLDFAPSPRASADVNRVFDAP